MSKIRTDNVDDPQYIEFPSEVEIYKQELIKKLREKYDRDSDPDYIYGITTAIQLIKETK